MKSPKILIDYSELTENDVNVIYMANDNWFETTIPVTRLRDFALSLGMNEVVYDFIKNGEHEQEECTLDFEEFFINELNYICNAWLQVYYIENPFEAITNSLGVLIQKLNDN